MSGARHFLKIPSVTLYTFLKNWLVVNFVQPFMHGFMQQKAGQGSEGCFNKTVSVFTLYFTRFLPHFDSMDYIHEMSIYSKFALLLIESN